MATLLPVVCTAYVTNASDIIEIFGLDASTGLGATLNELNCRPNGTVFLGGIGYAVKERIDTTHFRAERDYEGATSVDPDPGVSCTLLPFTPEMANRAELAVQLREYIQLAGLISDTARVGFDAFGTLAHRDDFDGVYLAADGLPFVYLELAYDGEAITGSNLHIKTSPDAGDWEGPISLLGPAGPRGWSSVYALAADGARRVQQLVGYVGGEGEEPTDHVGEYVGAAGYVEAIGDAVDIRGAAGASAAADVSFAPTGDLESEDVQSVIVELNGKKQATSEALTDLASQWTPAGAEDGAAIALKEATDNGAHGGRLGAPSILTADRDWTMPDVSGNVLVDRDPLSGVIARRLVPTPGGDGAVSVWRSDTPRTDIPRTATISAVAGDTITITTTDAQMFGRFTGAMNNCAYVRIWNASKVPEEAAWVKATPTTSTLQVLDAAAIAGWSNGETIRLGDPVGIAPTAAFAIDISPMLQNVLGAVFRQAGILARLLAFSSDASTTTVSISEAAVSGSLMSLKSFPDGSLQMAQFMIPCSVLSPISNSNLVFVREQGNVSIGGVTIVGVYV